MSLKATVKPETVAYLKPWSFILSRMTLVRLVPYRAKTSLIIADKSLEPNGVNNGFLAMMVGMSEPFGTKYSSRSVLKFCVFLLLI